MGSVYFLHTAQQLVPAGRDAAAPVLSAEERARAKGSQQAQVHRDMHHNGYLYGGGGGAAADV